MAGTAFATLEDYLTLYDPGLTDAEKERVEALLLPVSDCLRQEFVNCGRDLDAEIEAGAVLENTVKLVTVDVVSRVLAQSDNTDSSIFSQASQSALGYSWSGTYAVPGGGIANAIMRNDLARLGLYRQRIGVIELWPG